MKRNRVTRLLPLLAVLALVLLVGLTGEDSAGAAEKLGKVHFPVSCTPAAQQQFDRAVALLHSFWFPEAAKAFTAVAQTDASCAMAHWGSAMTWLGNPLAAPPSPRALKEGWAAVEKAKAAGAKTPREGDYIAAIELFYKDGDKVDHRTRAVAYEKAMEQLAQRYPTDSEAAIFYALALNITLVPTDKTYGNQLKAAKVLEKVFAEQPDHPGVAHYLIHSYDFPSIAQQGVAAARRYATIAPSAPHALHMPSHIFTRLGYWEESIATNRNSANVAKDEVNVTHPGSGSYNALHAMDYMVYGYLQLARDREAASVLEEIKAYKTVDVEHFAAAFAFAAMPARYALERRRWAEAAALTLHPPQLSWQKFPQAEAITVFARGLGAARSGDATAAKRDIARLQQLRDALTQAKSAYWAEQVDIQLQTVSAWLARAEGRNDEALRLMRAAADLEEATEKHPVTPGPIAPARELLGYLLLDVGQPAQALREFEKSHRVEPNRFLGLYGAARAAVLSGDGDKARGYFTQLVALAGKAETDRPELAEARAFLTKK
jgi:tetratricopeptide (TPR) repeat protein